MLGRETVTLVKQDREVPQSVSPVCHTGAGPVTGSNQQCNINWYKRIKSQASLKSPVTGLYKRDEKDVLHTIASPSYLPVEPGSALCATWRLQMEPWAKSLVSGEQVGRNGAREKNWIHK
jgi:hypothetical protein